MTQITVTENNDWEGEKFSYILNVDKTLLSKIKKGLKDCGACKIEENTSYTKEQVSLLNEASDNSYMDRFQFCELEVLPKKKFDWYDDIFYKAKGLKRNK